MLNYRLLGATALASSLLLASAAAAQTAGTAETVPQTTTGLPDNVPPTNADGSPADAGEDVLVTGSRIRAPNLESAAPITTIQGDQFYNTGKVAIGDTLNELPQLRNTYNQQNSTRFLGTRGLNLIDLYGLGTQRTLVLVNGRRHVAGDILNNGVSVDINTIPTDLIETVDILTGGASAVYGSDAIAGVVNFKLKQNFDGLQLRGQAGVSQYSDAGAQYLSAVAGKNFADGRGNIAANVEYAHQSAYYASGRTPFRRADGFVTVDTDPAGAVNGADDVIDRAYFQDIRSTTISLGGLLAIRYPNQPSQPCGNDAVGNSFTCNFLFQPNGSLIPQTGLRVGLGPTGSFINGNGYTGREGQLLTFTPNLDRLSFNVIGHFEVSPAFVPFFEAKYVKTIAQGSVSGPFFSQGQTLGDGIAVSGLADRSFINSGAGNAVNREGIRLDNPYLSGTARQAIQAQLLAAVNGNINPNTGTLFTTGVTAAQAAANRQAAIDQINAGTFRFSLRRNYLDLGIRDERLVRETYRIVGGVRGSFNDDWSYELSANYGEFKERNTIVGNVNRQRFLLANDTTTNAAGQIVCRSQVDSRYAGTDRGGNPSQLAADIAACVPLNPFGEGSVSQAARNYLLVNSFAEGKITQFDAMGYVAGDLSQLFELPGGPIGFSVGGEYRRETNFYDLDDLTQAGYAFYNAIPTLNPPTAFEVKEAFGEIRIPLLANLPFIKEFTISGSGRVADYKGSTGTVYAYSGDAVYRPVEGLTFRGTYARSVRAPNLGELYSSQSQNFAPGFTDPCSARNLATGSANRVANCNAAGRPASYDYVYSSSLEIRSGGNPDLQAETSDSYTAGILVSPRQIPGFSVSADYYDITVNGLIASTGTPQQIANLCYDSATLDNPFCSLFQRAGSGGGPRGEEPFRILEGSLLQSTANFAKLKTRGVNANLLYRHSFGWGDVNLNWVYTRSIQYDSFTNPINPNFQDRLLGELPNPKNRAVLNNSFRFGKFGFNYKFRFIDKMYLNTYEDYNALNGLPPQNTDYAPIVQYPIVTYHDVRFDLNATEKFNIYLGVDNVGNKLPPYGLTGVGAGSGIYDIRGRFAYVGIQARF
jgi:outer membrane receptor protein involved in Fe transport